MQFIPRTVLSTRELFSAAGKYSEPDWISGIVIVKFGTSYDCHHVVGFIAPVVDVQNSVGKSIAFQIPRSHSPYGQVDPESRAPLFDSERTSPVFTVAMI